MINMQVIKDKLLFVANEDEELRMRSDVLLAVYKELFDMGIEDNTFVRVDIDDNKWAEIDTYYNLKKGFLLQVKRTFDKAQNQKWIVDNVTSIHINKLIINNETIFI